MRRQAFVLAVAVIAFATTSAAQSKSPIGFFAADARMVSSGLPTEPGWTPTVPSGTIVPTRGFGVDFGVHVYVLRFRRIALGVGASLLNARGKTSPPEAASTGTTPPAPRTVPDVTTRVTSFAPQLSLNFGHSLGWSYVSAGVGQARASSDAFLPNSTTTFTPRESGWVKSLNYGGGARWYATDHFGFGFDIRWHKISIVPASNTHPGAPRASLFVGGAGIVVK
jgi:hypothetical protein